MQTLHNNLSVKKIGASCVVYMNCLMFLGLTVSTNCNLGMSLESPLNKMVPNKTYFHQTMEIQKEMTW